MGNETAWDAFEDGHEYTLGEIQERLQPVMDAAASRLAELQELHDVLKRETDSYEASLRQDLEDMRTRFADSITRHNTEKQALRDELDAARAEAVHDYEQWKKVLAGEEAISESVMADLAEVEAENAILRGHLEEIREEARQRSQDRLLFMANDALQGRPSTLTEYTAIAAEAMNRLGPCHLVTDQGDPIFGAFRQTRCMTHRHALAPCPVGLLRTRYEALAAISPAVEKAT